MYVPERLKPLLRRLLAARLPDWRLIHACYGALYRACYLAANGALVIKKMLWVDPIMRSLCSTSGKGLRMERVPWITGSGKIHLGDHIYISGKIGISFNSKLGLDPRLSIGSHSFIGHDCSFIIAGSITIGEHCRIAGGSRFYDNSGHPISVAGRRRDEPLGADKVRPIVIEDDVWIGSSCIILPGVHIGHGAIVGAGSVVTRDIAAGTIAAGNPAVQVRQLSEAEQQVETS